MGNNAFFKGGAAPKITSGTGTNLEARALAAPGYSGKAAAGASSKSLGQAFALTKAKGPLTHPTGSSAYPKAKPLT